MEKKTKKKHRVKKVKVYNPAGLIIWTWFTGALSGWIIGPKLDDIIALIMGVIPGFWNMIEALFTPGGTDGYI